MPSYHWDQPITQSNPLIVEPLLRARDLNRLNSFIDNPQRYATGTNKTKEKVVYLNSLVGQMSSSDKLRYQQARQLYETALEEKIAPNSIDLERKAELITEALNKGQTLTITYKGFDRDIYPYASDGKYCIAYCTINQELRTFRIDRMEKVRATGIFTQSQTLLAEARSRLIHAPKYQYHRTYR